MQRCLILSLLVSAVLAQTASSVTTAAPTQVAAESWHECRGPNMKKIVDRGESRTFALTTFGRIARYNSEEHLFATYPNTEEKDFVDFTLSCRGDIYGVNATGQVFYMVGINGNWIAVNSTLGTNITNLTMGSPTPTPSPTLTPSPTPTPSDNGTNITLPILPYLVKIAVGAGLNELWGLANDGGLYLYDETLGYFVSYPGNFTDIVVGCSGGRASVTLAITEYTNLWRREPDGTWLQVASGVKEIAYGARAYVLDDKNSLYKFVLPGPETSPNERTMFPLNEKFDSIASGKGDSLFGIRKGRPFVLLHGDAFHKLLGIEEYPVLRRLQGGRWKPVHHGARIVRVTVAKGVLYGLTRKGRVLRRIPRSEITNAWEPRWAQVAAPEPFRDISIGCDGTVWSISRELNTYRLTTDGTWERILLNLNRVSVGLDKFQVWGVTPEQKLVLYNDADKMFVEQPGERRIRRISAGCDNSLWAVSEAGRLLYRTTLVPEWVERGRGVKVVATGTFTYLLDRRGLLWRYAPPTDASLPEGRANWVAMHKQLRSIATDPQTGKLYGIDMKWKLVRFYPDDGHPILWRNDWRQIPGRFEKICTGNRNTVFGLRAGSLHRWDEKQQTFVVYPAPKLRDIQCGCDGSLWGIRRTGILYRMRNETIGWERLPRSREITKISAVRQNEAWGLDKEGYPREWNEIERAWIKHPGRLREIAASCNGEQFGIGINGGIWEYVRDTQKWLRIGAGARRLAISGRYLFVIGRVGHLFRRKLDSFIVGKNAEDLEKQRRFRIIGKARNVAAAMDGTVWALDEQGHIFQVYHSRLARLPRVPSGQPTAAPTKAEHELMQPDQWPEDPFQAGTDPEAVAAAKVNKHIDRQQLIRIANAGGELKPITIEQPTIVETPKPQPESAYGDLPDPFDEIEPADDNGESIASAGSIAGF